jgi:hypothetical protein
MTDERTVTDLPLGIYRAVTSRGVIDYRLFADRLEASGRGRFGRSYWRSTTPLCHLDSSFQEEERLYIDRWRAAGGGIAGGCVGSLLAFLIKLPISAVLLIPVIGIASGTVAIKQRVAGWATFPTKATFARATGFSVIRCERQPTDRDQFLNFVNLVSDQVTKCSKIND